MYLLRATPYVSFMSHTLCMYICPPQEFNALNLEDINNASTNGRELVQTTMGFLAVYNRSTETTKLGNISCLFDEFVTSKYVHVCTYRHSVCTCRGLEASSLHNFPLKLHGYGFHMHIDDPSGCLNFLMYGRQHC